MANHAKAHAKALNGIKSHLKIDKRLIYWI